MQSTLSESISALRKKAQRPGPLPIIIEEWLPTENGQIRLALCRSRYGWHWEVGSSLQPSPGPVQIVKGTQSEEAQTTCIQALLAHVNEMAMM